MKTIKVVDLGTILKKYHGHPPLVKTSSWRQHLSPRFKKSARGVFFFQDLQCVTQMHEGLVPEVDYIRAIYARKNKTRLT